MSNSRNGALQSWLCMVVQLNNTYVLKSSLMYGSSWEKGRFMKNFPSDTICNIIQ